jgi:formylglycine-generating enzyme required for sulfatase activity
MRHQSLFPLLSILSILGLTACGGGAFTEQGTADGGTGGTGDDASTSGAGGGIGDASADASADAGEPGVGAIGEASAGVCQPGDVKCAGLVPQVCGTSGQWEDGPACTYVCNTGACEGVCAPGAKQCNGSTPQTCNAGGAWESGSPCENVCTAGTCTGLCTPGSKQCNGNVPQTCSASGQWVNGTACSNVCASGACTGVCSPGTQRCSGDLTQTCDASGLWVDGSTCAYVCQSGACGGVCVPGATRCEGGGVQTCQSTGQWGTAVSCSTGTSCQAGHCAGSSAVPPSCSGVPAGCGPGGASSCCSTIQLPGGTFNRSNDPIYPATVSPFSLDVYEVTVGRFRAFVNAGMGTKSQAPAAGAGAHPAIGASGWQTAWNAELVSDSEDLENALDCDNTYATLANSSSGDGLPINCATWYEMFAFCAWDGGRLPTEAEWNYAAAGGSEQRTFPWVSGLIDPSYAVYDCTGDGSVSQQCAFSDILRVGSKSTKGDGRWGHADLAGSMSEAVLDMWSSPYASILCADCANLLPSSSRVIRGGAFLSPSSILYSSWRSASSPSARSAAVGFRCVRSP